MITTIGTAVGDEIAGARLLIWFSPAFPIGAFSFSHGLEWAVEAGDIANARDLTDWLDTLLSTGSGWTDAVLFAHAHRAASARDASTLAEVSELAIALQPSRERRLEATMQGEAFVRAITAAWPKANSMLRPQPDGQAIALAVAAGMATADAGYPLSLSLQAYLTGFAQNLVSAAIRLAPIGQTDGLRVLAALEGRIRETALSAASADLSKVGGLAARSDIASMRHETQMTRLFRS